MSISFDLAVASSNKVGLSFEEFPAYARDELVKEISGITAELEAAVKGLTPVRTGQLRASIVSGVFADETKITGRVSISGQQGSQIFAKAAALEYGAHKAAKVKAHTHLQKLVYGHYMDPRQVLVSAYSRTPDIIEYNFLRGPLGAMQSGILDRLKGAIDRASQQAGSP
jgi:hypothetical protein